ncbi:hypothetical protein N7455_002778 [Penicillium solitum]|uniref:uncharacterized protein n=1 Tax=Penicillium solitum TaxID=60172 RepID=UPI0032C48DD8|nr:hypothetical protein N7455_002778 [Penicillium solitum]
MNNSWFACDSDSFRASIVLVPSAVVLANPHSGDIITISSIWKVMTSSIVEKMRVYDARRDSTPALAGKCGGIMTPSVV